MLAFKGYAAVLIWIQPWPPLHAVPNCMASI
jgi:conjugal transfer mating pair stabilization protein TraG